MERLGINDAIELAGLTYRVTSTKLVAKSDIGKDREIWANTPGRLVVITCMQRHHGGLSRENLVIEATLA